MYVLEDDVYVDQDEKGKPIISWKGEVMMIDKRPTIELPVPNNCHPIHYGWRMNWYYETPPGYSVLITHPMNRFDLPFYTMSGIVESDIWGLPVFTAFFLQKDFIGVIPKGTPIFQIIPFKRDDWEREVSDDDDDLDNDLDNDEDGDGDEDMILGDYRGKIHYYKNNPVNGKASFDLEEAELQNINQFFSDTF